MLSNGNSTFLAFFINFSSNSMESLHFIDFPCHSMGICGLGSFGGGDGRMDGRADVWTCSIKGREVHGCKNEGVGGR